jgi:hypothetical protein
VPTGRRHSTYTLADTMLLVASTAAMFASIRACVTMASFEPAQAIVTPLAVFLSFGGYGAWAARRRGRSRFEGFCWGLIFGPFGVLMMALMPHRVRPSNDDALI